MLNFGIIGYPLGHSLSPALHKWVYAQARIEADYRAWPTPPDQLEAFLQRVRAEGLPGLSVTIPHKQTVISYLDELAPSATQVGAVNTLVWEDGHLTGHNTDVTGFLAPLRERNFHPENALILGAGGAARAVLAGLTSLSPRARISIAARNTDASEQLAEEFDARPLAWAERAGQQADLIVNTTPLGMSGSPGEGRSPLSREELQSILTPGAQGPQGMQESPRRLCLAYDLVYNPLQTPFLLAARAAGWDTQDGLDMLIAQGLEQVRLWTGQHGLPDCKAVRQTLYAQGLIDPGP